MSKLNSNPEPKSAKGDRPFPWRCPECRQRTVYPDTFRYSTEVRHDGRLHQLEFPKFKGLKCRTCGELVFDKWVEQQIDDALRAKEHLLSPDQIRRGIAELGLTQSEVAQELGIAEETVSRWTTGRVIQSKAMDRFLRVFFASPQARTALAQARSDDSFGAAVVVDGAAGLPAADDGVPAQPRNSRKFAAIRVAKPDSSEDAG